MILRKEITAEKIFREWSTWAWLLFFTTLFTVYGLLSKGVYSDDELTHALHLKTIWDHPSQLLNYFVRPGFKLLYLLQSGFGPVALILTNAIFSAVTCVFSSRIAARLKVPYPGLSGIICASIPIFYLLSFRMYGEVPSTMLFAIAVERFLAKRWFAAALIISGCFLIRQEMAMYAFVLGAWFIYKGYWKGILALAWAPLVLNTAGWIVQGDPLWVWNKYFSVFVNDVETKATSSLFLSLGYIFSSVLIFCGTIGILFGRKRLNLDKHSVWLIGFLLGMHYVLQYLMASGWVTNPSPGWWRFLNPMAPLISVFGVMGVLVILREEWWKDWRILSAFAILVAATVIFFSFKHNYYNIWKDGWREAPLMSILIFMGIVTGLRLAKLNEKFTMSAVAIFFLANNIFTTRPLKPTFEERTMIEVVEWVKKNHDPELPVCCNHIYYYYYANAKYDKTLPLTPGIQPEKIKAAPAGSLVIWESHYGYIESKSMGIPEAQLESYNLEEIKRYCGEGNCKSAFYVRIFRKK